MNTQENSAGCTVLPSIRDVVKESDIYEIIKLASYSSSKKNSQTTRYTVIMNRELKSNIADMATNDSAPAKKQSKMRRHL